MIRLLDRYIISEFTGPFFFGLFIYITIFIVDILMDLVDLFLTKNVAFLSVVKLFIYNIPNLLIIVIPMSVLFATLIVISNMSGSSEIIALKSGGISFYRIVLPFFIIGFFLSLSSFIISEIIVPRANSKAKNVFDRIMTQKPLPQIRPGDFNLVENRNVFYTKEKKGNYYADNILFEVKDRFPVLILAEKAFIDKKNWIFEKGNIFNFAEEGQNFRRIDFEEMKTPVFIEKEIRTSGKNSKNMNFFELKEKIRQFDEARIDTKKMKYELYLKTAIPFAAIVFTLIGAPLALAPVKSGKSIGMGFSILIIFLYYIFL
ncbi:MAG: LptF/LptG family permease, partial [Candidatus Muiribacteriaceae bacterium]